MRPCLIPVCAALLALLATACGRESRISTARVEAAFELVSDTNRVLLDESFGLVQAGDYPEALKAFRQIERTYKLTPMQEMAIQDLIQRLEARVPKSQRASDTSSSTVTNPPPRPTTAPR